MNESRPLHVGMVITYDLCEPGGGVKQHARQLAQSLRERGDRVTLFGPSSDSLQEPQVRGFRGVVNISSNASGNRLGVFISPFSLWRFIRAQQFDVLHIHEPLPPVVPYYAAWMSPGVPKIATFHAFSERSSPLLLAARRIFAPTILPYIHRGIAVSEPALRHARIDWQGPLNIIPNGICLQNFPPGAHSLSRRQIRLLFVGRTSDKRKGFDYLLAAVERSYQAGIDVQLHIVGERAAHVVRRFPPHVVHHGPLSEMELAAQYRRCDIFVAPSTGQESFGLVLLEAMSAARPIICSDIEGYRRIANPDGAQWVPPRNTEALSDAIAALTARPEQRRTMGESNAKYVKRFEWSLVTPRIREEYLRAIADCQRAREPALRQVGRAPTPPLWRPASKQGKAHLEPTEQVVGDV